MNLSKLSNKTLLAARSVAKTRLRAFFADPKAMIALRMEIARRGLK